MEVAPWGGGGQELSLEFTRLGREVYFTLLNNPTPEILDADQLKSLKDAIETTRVDSVPGPIYDNLNREVDARYIVDATFHVNVIEINKITWPEFISKSGHVHRLVFHEYLRVMGIDDDNYVLSAMLESEPLSRYLNLPKPSLSGKGNFEMLESYWRYDQKLLMS